MSAIKFTALVEGFARRQQCGFFEYNTWVGEFLSNHFCKLLRSHEIKASQTVTVPSLSLQLQTLQTFYETLAK